MNFVIKHEIKGRLRIHVKQKRMTCREADVLQYYLDAQEMIVTAKIYERTQDVVVTYVGEREQLLQILKEFHGQQEEENVPEMYLQNSGRELNSLYWEKLMSRVIFRMGSQLFVPAPVRTVVIYAKAVRYLWKGLDTLRQKKIEVPVLDATAISVSLIRGDIKTAGSVMFLLGIGEVLEEWTHKKSVGDLARSMSLNIEKVWLVEGDREIQISASEVLPGEQIKVYAGNMIPFDGKILSGDAMVNQSSLTGESVPVHKTADGYAYAGTVLVEGELVMQVEEDGGSSKFEKIVTMIEESEKLKSSLEGKASHFADQLVPYTLAGSGLTYLFTRNITKALSVLMVDFSCALKLAMPIAVLAAIREASAYQVTVKGGKYLEAMAEADTIVFDKTGTLTKACPRVVDVISFDGQEPDELLRLAACMEEHFPHSMAKAVVDAAKEKNLVHEEIHSRVEYIVAHGISTMVEGKKAIIGSHHFVFEDEQCMLPKGMEKRFRNVPTEYSCLYLAIENRLSAVICIEDPLRKEAASVVKALKSAGIKKVVMMTGDSERIAASIAKKVGVDEYYSEVLPEDKAKFVEEEKAQGRTVVMIGDGINDSPALSAADVGIAVHEGAQIAQEIADVTMGTGDLYELVTLKEISNSLMKRIRKNYHQIVGINAALILLGIFGVMPPTMSALLHNTSTLLISLESMQNLLD